MSEEAKEEVAAEKAEVAADKAEVAADKAEVAVDKAEAEKEMPKKCDKKKCSRCRKIIRRTLLTILILFVVFLTTVGIIVNRLDPIVKYAVETYGPKYLGVPVTLEEVNFSILRMRFELKNLVIGNPEGYKTDNAISLGRILVSVKPSSLLGNPIEIEQILVEEPQVTYEVGLGNSNIGTILENVKKATAGDPQPAAENAPQPAAEPAPQPAAQAEAQPAVQAEAQPAAESGKKVVIDELRITDGKIRLSAKIMQGVAAPIPLPDIEMKDIGKEKEEGASFLDATCEVMEEFLDGVVETAKASGGAVVDGAKAAGGAVVDGAKAAGGAIVDGVKALGSGIFGGDKDEE